MVQTGVEYAHTPHVTCRPVLIATQVVRQSCYSQEQASCALKLLQSREQTAANRVQILFTLDSSIKQS
jgi:sulfur relay (sulfurtransferase) complex TusBCD TusD component (DsrE family)